MEQDVQQMMKELEAIGHRMAKRMEKQLERQRTIRMILFYSAIFLPIAWLMTNPVWSWAVLGVGIADWIFCKVFRPIHLQLMEVTVHKIEREDNS